MNNYAYATGLSSEKTQRRYLWTDAFALCNFLEINPRTGNENYKKVALLLVDKVHRVLGWHREDDIRSGWISGLSVDKGEKHPTKGGLRIGKELNERPSGFPLDSILEWKRDGQYFHYLTKWMHALNRLSTITENFTYNQWAIELAKTAHNAFIYTQPFSQKKRMYWKMSIDLSRPLVSSMGQHDPLDGFITYNQLQATALEHHDSGNLTAEIAEISCICKGNNWVTEDPLGLGSLLCNAYEVAQLINNRYWEQTALLLNLLQSSQVGLKTYLNSEPLRLSANSRLAFRELGLSLGLHAVEKLSKLNSEKPELFDEEPRIYSMIDTLMRYVPLTKEIEKFWLEPTNRQTNSWKEHSDINMVMLATSLIPNGYLG